VFDIRAYQKEIEQLCQQYNVEELAMFGSALRDDFDLGQSDIDFVVTFKPMEPISYAKAYFGFLESLELLLGRKVDLLTWRAVRNPFMRASIEKTRETIYAAQG
jgi:uncharacterized protein